MIWFANSLISGVFDLLMRPFRLESPWPGMIAASFGASLLLIVLFWCSSDSAAIRRTRNRLIARTLELLMFQHDLRVSFTACGRILSANCAYMLQFLRPMAVGMIPLLLIFVQMESWFDRRPLRTGEQTVLTVELDPTRPVLSQTAELHVSETVRVDSQPVRSPSTNELAWRIVATGEGDTRVDVIVGEVTERKSLCVGHRVGRLSVSRESDGILRQVLSPSEQPLASSGPIRRIQVQYPPREFLLGQTEVSWLVVAVGLMMIFSPGLGRLFGIRIA